MSANHVTAVAAVCLVAMGGFALYYHSDSARETRYLERHLDASVRAQQMGDSVRAANSLRLAAEDTALVAIIDSATAKRCTYGAALSASTDDIHEPEATLPIRLRSVARQHTLNAVLVTDRQRWMIRGDGYFCRPSVLRGR